MKPCHAVALIALATMSLGAAHAQTRWQVQTEKGVFLVVTDVKAGRFEVVDGRSEFVGKDSRGQPVRKQVGGKGRFFEGEMTVPYRPGAAFGHRFVLPVIPDGDSIVLEAQTVAPRKLKSGKKLTDTVESSRTYTSADSGKRQTWFWRFNNANDKTLLGVWVRRISQYGRPLAEATFTLVP
jgi:hypothetical protein